MQNGKHEEPSGDDIRAAIARRANRPTPARLLLAMRDAGVDLIVEAVRRITIDKRAYRRANMIADEGQRMRWAHTYLALIDELRLHGASDEDVLGVCEAVAEAGRQRVYVGTGIPQESVGEALALEAIAEGEGNRDTALLINEPHSPGRLRAAWQSLTFHQTRLDRARRVLARQAQHLESQGRSA